MSLPSRAATSRLGLLLALLPALASAAAPAPEAASPWQLRLQLRPRWSYATQDNKPLRAEVGSLRLRLGLTIAPDERFQFVGEWLQVGWLDAQRANSTPGNARSPYPLVADPPHGDLNLLYADFAGPPDTRIRLGRQSIRLDNERFVGDGDVRQTPQVFDAVSVRNGSLPDTQLFAAQAWQVRSVFGERFAIRTTLLNARHALPGGVDIGAYGYWSAQPRIHAFTGLADVSNRIVGVRAEGRHRGAGALGWYWTAERAWQQPWAGGDARVRAGYRRLAAGPTWNGWSLQVGHEVLGSPDGSYGLQMPLSYNVFQGWAYEFFSTPARGVRDLSVALNARFGPLSAWLKHHRFEDDFGGRPQGREWDVALAWQIDASNSVRAAAARFLAAPGFARPSAARHTLSWQLDY